MTISAKTGAFNTGTAVAGTVFTIGSLGFAPKAVMFWWSGRTENVDAAGTQDIQRGYGFALGTSSRCFVTDRKEDNTTTANLNRAHGVLACIATITDAATPAIDGLIDVNAFGADNIDLIVDDAMPVSLRVCYLALGGDDLVNYTITSFAEPGASGAQTVTSIGFQPDAMIMVSCLGGNTDTAAVAGGTSIGICTSPTTTSNFVLAGRGQDGAGTSVVGGYCRSGECYARQSSSTPQTAVDARGFVSQFHSTGFTFTWNEDAVAGNPIYVLALKGGLYTSGSVVTSTSNGATITASGIGFTSKALLFASGMAAEHSADAPSTFDKWSLGAATGPAERNAQAVIDEHNRATMDMATAVEHDEVYIRLDDDANTVVGLMDLETITSGGFNCVMDDGDTSASFVWFLAIGPNNSGGAAAVSTLNTIERRVVRGAGRGMLRGAA